MRIRLTWLSVAAAFLTACAGVQETRITDIADLPVKSIMAPQFNWQNSPLRANSMYVFHEANTDKQRAAMVGDYYYVNWDDADPDKPVRMLMRYTQAATGADVKERVVEMAAGRGEPSSRKTEFFFNGEERRLKGDIMSWRVELYVDGVLKDARQSYLWE